MLKLARSYVALDEGLGSGYICMIVGFGSEYDSSIQLEPLEGSRELIPGIPAREADDEQERR